MRGIHRLLREQDGATAVFVAFALFVLLGTSAIAIDYGSMWTERRSVVIATDSAALAAAATLAEECDEAAAQSAAGDLVSTNGASLDAVAPTGDCDSGHVRVDGHGDAALFFGPVLGVNESHPAASSTAEWGPSQSAEGLRPIALCDADPHIGEWPDPDPALIGSDWDHPAYPNAGVVHRFANDKESVELCGGEENKWVWTCFDGDPCGNGNAIRPWLENGYPRAVDLGIETSGDEDCSEAGGLQNCEGKEGALGGSLTSALDGLVCITSAEQCVGDGKAFSVLLYDTYDKHDGYHPTAFLGVVLRGWEKGTGNVCGTNDDEDVVASDAGQIQAAAAPGGGGGNDGGGGGQPAAPDKCGYVDLEFVDIVTSGRVGPVDSSLPSVTAFGLCGADHDSVEHRCDY